jgi:hypothetical protein
MKKYFFVFALTIIVETGIFAQKNGNEQFNFKSGTTEQKNAVSIDFGTLIWDLSTGGFGTGVSYERSHNDKFSLLGHSSFSYHE